MASPQLENGYTRVSNEILEALCRVNLSPYESRALWFILRKTYGHQKKTDRISLSQIEKATGINRGCAGRALRSLRARNMVIGEAGELGIQKNYEQWQARPPVSPKTPPVSVETLCLQRPQNGVSADLKMVSPETPQKKERKKKDSVRGKPSLSNGSDPRVKEFFAWWKREYQTRFSASYVFNGGKDGATLKRLLQNYDLQQLNDLALRFLDSKDPWVRENGGYTIGVFASQINKLVSTSKASQISPQAKELPL